jgi:pterin-4a-carbinolamine dehydratase
MKGFFMPLISGAVDLAKRMCDRARKAGHPPKIAIAVGGTVENKWFTTELFAQLKEDVKIATCEKWVE